MAPTKNKYATLDIPGAMGFREITQELSKEGHNITPAKARLVLLSVLEKITKQISVKSGFVIPKNKIKDIVQKPNFQNDISEIIEMAYQKGGNHGLENIYPEKKTTS